MPETWTVKTLMSKRVSRPSNPTIAGCIYLTGKIETWGRGVEKVVRECRKHGCPKPLYSANPGEPGDIMVRVDASSDAIVEASANNGETINGPINGPINDRILQFIRKHTGCKRADIAQGVGISLRSLKRDLEELSGRVQYRGSKKTGGYYSLCVARSARHWKPARAKVNRPAESARALKHYRIFDIIIRDFS